MDGNYVTVYKALVYPLQFVLSAKKGTIVPFIAKLRWQARPFLCCRLVIIP